MDTKKKENSEQSAGIYLSLSNPRVLIPFSDEASLYNTIASVIPKKQDVVRIIGKMTNPAYGFTGLSQLEKMRHTTLSKLLSTSLADEFCFIDTVEEVLAPYTSDYNGIFIYLYSCYTVWRASMHVLLLLVCLFLQSLKINIP